MPFCRNKAQVTQGDLIFCIARGALKLEGEGVSEILKNAMSAIQADVELSATRSLENSNSQFVFCCHYLYFGAYYENELTLKPLRIVKIEGYVVHAIEAVLPYLLNFHTVSLINV
jgi:hypothetical protein